MIIPFGKYKNKDLEDIVKIDRQYLDYIYRVYDLNYNLKKEIKVLLDSNSPTDNEYGKEDIILDTRSNNFTKCWEPPV